MSATTPLYIPMKVEALVVNNQVSGAQSFIRRRMDYTSLNDYQSPLKLDNDAGWAQDENPLGVHLHWHLPEAMCHGTHDTQKSYPTFPLVPNRWVVLRFSGTTEDRKTKGWIIESDHLSTDAKTSPSRYIDPFEGVNKRDKVVIKRIGKKSDIADWKENPEKSEPFLTAVGPGDITFSAYQPNVENVFSIHDDLADLNDKETLSYMIAGWYSAPEHDLLAGLDTLDKLTDFLEAQEWSCSLIDEEGNPVERPNQSICHGFVFDLKWNKTGQIPESKRPTNMDDIKLAIGDTSIDALTTLVRDEALKVDKLDTINPLMLEALQYDLLGTAEQKNHEERLYQEIHKAWFKEEKGGVSYVIHKKADAEAPHDFDATPKWLIELNQNQTDYEKKLTEVQQLQWHLYRMWFAHGRFNQLSTTSKDVLDWNKKDFENQLNPDVQGSLADIVKQKLSELEKIKKKLPLDILPQNLRDFSNQHQLHEAFELKAVNRENFYIANDPAILLTGLNAEGMLAREDILKCRAMDELIKSLTFDGKTIKSDTLNGAIHVPDLQNLPRAIQPLLNEFLFLDHQNAPWIAKKAKIENVNGLLLKMQEHSGLEGQLPDTDLGPWQQPWSPLFLEWSIRFYPIPYTSHGKNNWHFDGTGYHLDENSKKTDVYLNFRGQTILLPTSIFNLQHRLKEFKEKYPSLNKDEIANLNAFMEETNSWDVLSQSMDDITSQLSSRINEWNKNPGKAHENVYRLTRNLDFTSPMLGALPNEDGEWAPSKFQNIRAGQFYFDRLVVVDRFGQTAYAVTEQTIEQVAPYTSPSMRPKHPVSTQNSQKFIELKPRLIQPARLNFEFVSTDDDTKTTNIHADQNPICAWIIPNHLNRSLACFDNNGAALGEVRLVTNAKGDRIFHWNPNPNKNNCSLQQIREDFPHLGEFLNGLSKQTANTYDTLFGAIDSTLWSMDPLGQRDDANLSVLIGRPLALTRACLSYELKGQPYNDPSWRYTFDPVEPEFIDYDFQVCLGQLILKNDGLIGYFLNNDYDHLNLVNKTQPNNDYLPEIKYGNFINLKIRDGQKQFVTMLMDPRASVHATTNILPGVTLELPDRYVTKAFDAMEVSFDTGPYLSTLEKLEISEAPGDDKKTPPDTSLLVPPPAQRNGHWQWQYQKGETLQTYPLKAADANAVIPPEPPILRTGKLIFSNYKNR